MFCQSCGMEVASTYKMCPKCGGKQFGAEMVSKTNQNGQVSESREDGGANIFPRLFLSVRLVMTSLFVFGMTLPMKSCTNKSAEGLEKIDYYYLIEYFSREENLFFKVMCVAVFALFILYSFFGMYAYWKKKDISHPIWVVFPIILLQIAIVVGSRVGGDMGSGFYLIVAIFIFSSLWLAFETNKPLMLGFQFLPALPPLIYLVIHFIDEGKLLDPGFVLNWFYIVWLVIINVHNYCVRRGIYLQWWCKIKE